MVIYYNENFSEALMTIIIIIIISITIVATISMMISN